MKMTEEEVGENGAIANPSTQSIVGMGEMGR